MNEISMDPERVNNAEATKTAINSAVSNARAYFLFNESYFSSIAFCLKYSPSTDLTVSGTVSSLRAFRSCSKAFIISSDIETMTFCIAKLHVSLPLDTYNNLNIGIGIYQSVVNGICPALTIPENKST